MAQFSPAERDLIDWFVQLSREEKTAAAGLAYETWPARPAFQRFYLEKRGYSLTAYLASRLSEPELTQWAAEQPPAPAS